MIDGSGRSKEGDHLQQMAGVVSQPLLCPKQREIVIIGVVHFRDRG
jgi:hypothetical protein